MFKKIIIAILALLIATWVGIKLASNPGYVLIAYGHMSVETTLWFAFVVIVVGLLVIFLLAKIIDGLLSIGGRLRRWSSKRKLKQAQLNTIQGITELLEADFKASQKHLLAGAITKPGAVINYIALSINAQLQQNYDQRDQYLTQARQLNKQLQLPIGILQAKLQRHANQLEQSLATLNHLYQQHPQQKAVLQLMHQVLIQLSDWQSLEKLLPALKRQVLSSEEYRKLEADVFAAKLADAVSKRLEVEACFMSIPKKLRTQHAIVLIYANYLFETEQHAATEKLLVNTLNHHWHPDLLYLYSKAKVKNPGKQLQQLEAWNKQHHNEPTLLYALGKACVANQLWGKAQDYLQQSIELHPVPATYQQLGLVFEKIGDNDRALEAYKQGLNQ